jgi:hypothetical protein
MMHTAIAEIAAHFAPSPLVASFATVALRCTTFPTLQSIPMRYTFGGVTGPCVIGTPDGRPLFLRFNGVTFWFRLTCSNNQTTGDSHGFLASYPSRILANSFAPNGIITSTSGLMPFGRGMVKLGTVIEAPFVCAHETV